MILVENLFLVAIILMNMKVQADFGVLVYKEGYEKDLKDHWTLDQQRERLKWWFAYAFLSLVWMGAF